MKRVLFVLTIVAATVWTGPRVDAACHFFTVGASSSVGEGNRANVIIERDAAAAPSSVRVQTVNGTARAPADFTAFDQRIEFTNETQKTISIQTREDASDEPNETFQVRVSEGQGCAVNPNFDYGDPAQITITDDDDPAPTVAPTQAPRPTTTTIPARTRTPEPTDSPTPSPSATPTPTATASASPSPSFSPTPVEEEGGFPWLPVLAVVGFLAAGAGALIITRLRGGGV